MSKLDCDIIRDLLPSYVDGICSDATRRCVEEHLRDCPECGQLMRQLRDTDFTADKLEQREFDGFKKARRQIKRQGISGTLLAVALVLSAIAGAWLIGHSGAESIKTYYVLLGICILCTINYANSRKPEKPIGKADWAMAVISAAVTTCISLLLFYTLKEFVLGRMPFGMAPYQFGSLMRYLLNASAIGQMALFAVLMLRLVKRGIDNGWILNLCLTGACAMHLHETFLGSMDLTFATLGRLISEWGSMTGAALTIGLAGIALSLILSKARMKKA